MTSVSRPVKSNPVTEAERLAAEQSAETLADDLGLPVNADIAAVVSTIGPADKIVGDFHCATPLHIEGRVEGRVFVIEHGVRIARHAHVHADIVAAVVTVRGAVTGRVTAARRVRITSSGRVEGIVSAPEVIVEDGGWLLGRVDPQRTDPAISVARHRLR
ncbi:MAG: polymer-forming cytoskeletal protein [Acidobacteria bacterium]|nr:polymer-forming cytoskeletal protein [Acidobacteriota bacterium]